MTLSKVELSKGPISVKMIIMITGINARNPITIPAMASPLPVSFLFGSFN